MHFISQHDSSKHSEAGCGVASLLMLLHYIGFKPMPTWETLCETLKLDATPSTKGYGNSDPEVGLYPEDLFRYVIHHNLKFRMHFFEDEWQEALLKTPIMVLMDGILEAFPDETHWIVLIQYDEQQFTYLDPFEKTQATALKRLEMKQFKLLYTGIACQLFA